MTKPQVTRDYSDWKQEADHLRRQGRWEEALIRAQFEATLRSAGGVPVPMAIARRFLAEVREYL